MLQTAGGPKAESAELVVVIEGQRPVTWKRPNGTGKRYNDPKDQAWRDLVTLKCREAMNKQGIETFRDDVQVVIMVGFLSYVRADADNLAKGICDAMTAAMVYQDDNQIVSLHVELWYGLSGKVEGLEAEPVDGLQITVRNISGRS